MAEQADAPRELPLGRLEAFSDGVFAIAITLLVLELAVGEDAGADLVRGILEQWPSYLAYVTSFLTIGAVWMAHSAVTGALRAADGVLYRLNLIVMLVASFLPFPTRLIGEFIDNPDAERVAAAFYGIALLALSIAFSLFVRHAARTRRLVKEHVSDDALAAAAMSAPTLGFYAVAILVSVFLPIIAVALYLAIAVSLTIPADAVRRLLRQSP
jgi:uncharacterized membrane protein